MGCLERKEFPVTGNAGAEEEYRWGESTEGIRQLMRGMNSVSLNVTSNLEDLNPWQSHLQGRSPVLLLTHGSGRPLQIPDTR